MQSTTLKVPPNQERTSGRLYEDPLGTGPGGVRAQLSGNLWEVDAQLEVSELTVNHQLVPVRRAVTAAPNEVTPPGRPRSNREAAQAELA